MTQTWNSAIDSGNLFARLGRPQNVLYPGFLSALTCYIIGGKILDAAVCYLFFITLYTLAVCYNNFIDRVTDRHNKRTDIPSISHKQILVFAGLNGAIFLLLQFALEQPDSILLGVIYFALSFAYSNPKISIQSRGWWAQSLLALCYGVIPLLLGLSQVDPDFSVSKILLLSFLQIALLYPILLAKDYKDLKGDRQTGKKTPLVRYGPTAVRRVAYLSAFIAVILCLMAFQGISVLLIISLVTYLTFVRYLHKSNGKIHWLKQRIGTLSLLTISLILLSS